MMKALTVAIGLILSSLLLPSAAEGSSREKQWDQRIEKLEELLQEREYVRAETTARKLTKDFLDYLNRGFAARRTLAKVCALRAIAHLGQREEDDALWYWDVALSLYDGVRGLNYAPYGEVGLRLQKIPFRSQLAVAERAWPEEVGKSSQAVATQNLGKIERPKVRKRPRPKYPRGMRSLRVETVYVVQVVIDETGRVLAPKVISEVQEASLVYAALEALRDWRFEPALREGEPVPVYYNLTVNFELRG